MAYQHYTDSIERAIKGVNVAPVNNPPPIIPAVTVATNSAPVLTTLSNSAPTTQAPLPTQVLLTPSYNPTYYQNAGAYGLFPLQQAFPPGSYQGYAPSVSQPYYPVNTMNALHNPYGANAPQPTYFNGNNGVPPPGVTSALPVPVPPPPVPAASSRAVTRRVSTRRTYVPPTATATTLPEPSLSSTPPTAVNSSSAAYKVKPDPAVPPNWEKLYNDAIHVLAPFTSSPVKNHSIEYQTLAALVEPQLTVSAINRIVNPHLWKKFLQTRKELMSQKSEDLGLLGALGLPEAELLHRAHVNMNFTKEPGVAAVEYSDNVALLFHCTRGKVEPILNQGLDERLGSSTGLLGRGIYFADDPLKSVGYDSNSTLIVFAVLLGDCLSVVNLPNLQTFVREPAKVSEQQRNHMDLFFDSIVGRPAGVNEFVIYNRNQCCPLYTINYTRAGSTAKPHIGHTQTRADIPPFAWSLGAKSTKKGNALPTTGNIIWPFFAQTIFAKMWGDEEKPTPADTNGAGAVVDLTGQDSQGDDGKGEESIVLQLSALWELGFEDDASNLALLKKFNYNLEQTIDGLLQGIIGNPRQPTVTVPDSDPIPAKTRKLATAGPSPSSSAVAVSYGNGNGGTAAATITSASTALEEDCPICCVEFPAKWRTLKCSHKVCEACYLQLQTSGVTMSGVAHTFVKCPFCQSCSGGLEIGTCPSGSMTVTKTATSVPGYEQYGSYTISYNVPGSIGLNRTAYIPASNEGEKVVDLLRIAWDRRLCFTIGTSVTTGAQNVLVWNIHHKTAMVGGIQAYGYPDPTYLTRVQQELAQYGIE